MDDSLRQLEIGRIPWLYARILSVFRRTMNTRDVVVSRPKQVDEKYEDERRIVVDERESRASRTVLFACHVHCDQLQVERVRLLFAGASMFRSTFTGFHIIEGVSSLHSRCSHARTPSHQVFNALLDFNVSILCNTQLLDHELDTIARRSRYTM